MLHHEVNAQVEPLRCPRKKGHNTAGRQSAGRVLQRVPHQSLSLIHAAPDKPKASSHFPFESSTIVPWAATKDMDVLGGIPLAWGIQWVSRCFSHLDSRLLDMLTRMKFIHLLWKGNNGGKPHFEGKTRHTMAHVDVPRENGGVFKCLSNKHLYTENQTF